MRPIAPLAELWSGITGSEPRLTRDSMVALRTGNPVVRHDKARAELGHAPRPLRTTVEDTLRWFRDGDRPRPRRRVDARGADDRPASIVC